MLQLQKMLSVAATGKCFGALLACHLVPSLISDGRPGSLINSCRYGIPHSVAGYKKAECTHRGHPLSRHQPAHTRPAKLATGLDSRLVRLGWRGGPQGASSSAINQFGDTALGAFFCSQLQKNAAAATGKCFPWQLQKNTFAPLRGCTLAK